MAINPVEPRIELQSRGQFLLTGALSFASVPGLLGESQRLLSEGGRTGAGITIDLQGVGRTDSAGLALLVEWTRNFRSQGVDITFLNIPVQLLALARLSGLEGVLSLSNPSSPPEIPA